jgi:hypothetical protein
MVRLLVEDVTLLRGDEIVAHVRFRGGAVRTLHLPLPLSAPDLRRTDPAVIAELDRLLDEHTDAEAAERLNATGLQPGVAARFNAAIVIHLRRKHGLADRFTRLRARGLLTLPEISELLGADADTVKVWARKGRIPSELARDNGVRLFPVPADLHRRCARCGSPIPARPALRSGKKWCSMSCAQKAYRSRKRASTREDSTPDTAHEVQSVA